MDSRIGSVPIPPQQPHRSGKKEGEKPAEEAPKAPQRPAEGPKDPAAAREAALKHLEAQAKLSGLAEKLQQFAKEARQSGSLAAFTDELFNVMKKVGILDSPQAAMEEANRRLQEEIDAELARILEDEELMDEAEKWQRFADLLERDLTEEQAQKLHEALSHYPA